MTTHPMMLALVSALSLGAAACVAHAQEASMPASTPASTPAATPARGSVQVQARAAKAVVAGPIAIHAYSEFSGATVFVVAAVSGSDPDCTGARTGARTSLHADRAQTLTVGAGELACVETAAARGSEVLWHAQPTRAAAPILLASAR